MHDVCGMTQVSGGNAGPSGRPRPGHPHHQLQCETLSDWQRVPDKTQTVRGSRLSPGEGQSQRCYHEGPGGCEVLLLFMI